MGVEEYDVVETLFRKQNFTEYYMTLYGLAEGLEANELYNANRPGHVPAGARFREHVTTMKELGTGADRGDFLLKERRQAARDLSEIDMYASVSYMRTIAIDRRDPTILHTLGLPLKANHHKSSRRGASAQASEIHLEVRHVKGESWSHRHHGEPCPKRRPVSDQSLQRGAGLGGELV